MAGIRDILYPQAVDETTGLPVDPQALRPSPQAALGPIPGPPGTGVLSLLTGGATGVPPTPVDALAAVEAHRQADLATIPDDPIATAYGLPFATEREIAGAVSDFGEPVGPGFVGMARNIGDVGDFYSRLQRYTETPQFGSMQKKATGQEYFETLQQRAGQPFSEAELDYTLGHLKESGVEMNRQQLLEQIEANQLEVVPVTLGHQGPSHTADEYAELIQQAERRGDWDEAHRLTVDWEASEGLGTASDAPRWNRDNLVLPGGENYREVLLTLPKRGISDDAVNYAAVKIWNAENPSDAVETFDELKRVYGQAEANAYGRRAYENIKGDTPLPFREPTHFPDHENVVAHIRMNERMVNGERVLFIEEIQSDWARELRRQKNDLEVIDSADAFPDGDIERGEFFSVRDNETGNIIEGGDGFTMMGEEVAMDLIKSKQGAPDMPFKQKWVDLAAKKIVQMAADEGFDRIAWVTGKQTADRYNLAKYLDDNGLNYEDHLDGTYSIDAVAKNGENIEYSGIDADELEEIVGKGMAKRIVEGEGISIKDERPLRDMRALRGEDLALGGEWALHLYDQQFPSSLKKAAGNSLTGKERKALQVEGLDMGEVYQEPKFEGVGSDGSFVQHQDALDYADMQMSDELYYSPPDGDMQYISRDEAREILARPDYGERGDYVFNTIDEDDMRVVEGKTYELADNQSLKLTPEHREKIKRTGQSLLGIGGVAAMGAYGQEQQQ